MNEDRSSSEADEHAPVLALGCLGHLGGWGNMLFQYAFFRVIANANRHRRVCPRWLGHVVFGLDDEAAASSDLGASSASQLPIVADRVVLSHMGWRRWAARREPMASMVRTAGGSAPSGRKLRQSFPQVWRPSRRLAPPALAMRARKTDRPPVESPHPRPGVGRRPHLSD